MARSRTLTGLDIGSRAIKIVRLRTDGDRIFLTHVLKIPLGGDEADASAESLEGRLRDGLQKAGLAGLHTPVAVGGGDVILRYQTVMPTSSLSIVDIVNFEVSDVADRIEGGVSYNFDVLDIPSDAAPADEGQSDIVVLTAMAKNHYLDNLALQLKGSGVRVDFFTPLSAALASALAATGQVKPDDVALLLDVGAQYTSLVAVRGSRPFFLRTMPFGGEAVTKAIARRLRMPPAEAERAKRNTAHVLESGPRDSMEPHEQALCEVATRQVEQLCAIVQSSLRFAEAQLKATSIQPARIFLSGGTAKLAGIVPFMQSRFDTPVYPLNLHNHLDLRMLSNEEKLLLTQNAPQFAAAIGSALSQTDEILPLRLRSQRQRDRRTFLRRHLFLFASVLLTVLALGFYTASLLAARNDLLAERESAKKTADGARRERLLIGALKDERKRVVARRDRLNEQIAGHQLLLRVGAALTDKSTDAPHTLPPNLLLDRLSLVPTEPKHRKEYKVSHYVKIVLVDRSGKPDVVTRYLKKFPKDGFKLVSSRAGEYEIHLLRLSTAKDTP